MKPKNNSIKIDKGVPLANRGGRNPSIYAKAVLSMAKGDSFFVRCENAIHATAERARLASLAGQIGRGSLNGAKFATRCVDGGVRLWRVE